MRNAIQYHPGLLCFYAALSIAAVIVCFFPEVM